MLLPPQAALRALVRKHPRVLVAPVAVWALLSGLVVCMALLLQRNYVDTTQVSVSVFIH